MDIISLPAEQVDLVLLEARGRLATVNNTYAELRRKHQSEFTTFWYKNGQLRSPEEINSILDRMDSLAPGGSALYFASAWILVQTIQAIESLVNLPENSRLSADGYLPRYDLSETPQGGRRVVAPL